MIPGGLPPYLGDFLTGTIVRHAWNTETAVGASVTRSTNGTVRVYKNDSTTERTSSAGITDSEDFDTLTGVHHIKIDLADNTDAGFYAAGNDYFIILSAATIDGQTVNVCLATFSIQNRTPKVDVAKIAGDTTAATNLYRSASSILVATVSGSPTTTSVPASDLPSSLDNDALKGRIIVFLGNVTAALKGEASDVTVFVGSTKVLTVSPLTSAPAVGDIFVVV